jgi:hypothetical protein
MPQTDLVQSSVILSPASFRDARACVFDCDNTPTDIGLIPPPLGGQPADAAVATCA